MAAPFGLESTIRVHDEAFYTWLGTLKVDYGDAGGLLTTAQNNFPILRTFAGPQRAYASVTDLLVRQGFVSGDTAQKMRDEADNFAVLPLPIATIERGQPAIDTERATPPKSISTAYFNTTTATWESHENPTVYTLPYTVTFWCIKQYTMNYILEFLYSQFGNLGSASTERFLTVSHAEPWQAYPQALKFEGTSDMTEVEGENPAYRRFEATFNLRMLHFRPKEDSSYGDQTLYPSQDFFSGDTSDGVDTTIPTDAALAEVSTSSDLSGNLFTFYVRRMSDWAVGGNAKVARGTMGQRNSHGELESLQIKVTESTDVADIATRVIGLDADGKGLLSISFRYQATEAVKLDVSEKTAITDTFSKAYTLDLPKAEAWTQVHFYTYLTEKMFSLTVEGAGNASTVTLDNVNIKHVRSKTKTTASGTDAGGYTTYTWSGLDDSQAYLVVLPITRNAASAVTGVLAIQDDSSTPPNTRNIPIAQAFSGAAGIIQPRAGGSTVLAFHADTITAGTPYLQPYNGFFDGHEI
jgi:hypothetical protein